MSVTSLQKARATHDKRLLAERRGKKSADGQIRVLHIINDLSVGGAEMVLYRLLAEMDRERFEPVVISLIDRGSLRSQIKALGIPVHSPRMKPGFPPLASWWRLFRLVRKLKPDLIQGWMHHANFASQLSRMFVARKTPVVWSIRGSVYSLALEKRLTSLVIRMCAPLSRFADAIIFVSQTSRSQHDALGFTLAESCVLPNGIDTSQFVPSPRARRSLRHELGIPDETILIGQISRFHPMKDHDNFLRAAAAINASYPDVQFVLSGTGVDWDNKHLRKLIQQFGIVERIHLLGERQDMARIMAAQDIVVSSSSWGEGFGNVIGEAMSCGVPCVVTDVGDLPLVVGETGVVVAPRNPDELSRGIQELIELGPAGRSSLGASARARVERLFPLDAIVAEYARLYAEVVGQEWRGISKVWSYPFGESNEVFSSENDSRKRSATTIRN